MVIFLPCLLAFSHVLPPPKHIKVSHTPKYFSMHFIRLKTLSYITKKIIFSLSVGMFKYPI